MSEREKNNKEKESLRSELSSIHQKIIEIDNRIMNSQNELNNLTVKRNTLANTVTAAKSKKNQPGAKEFFLILGIICLLTGFGLLSVSVKIGIVAIIFGIACFIVPIHISFKENRIVEEYNLLEKRQKSINHSISSSKEEKNKLLNDQNIINKQFQEYE